MDVQCSIDENGDTCGTHKVGVSEQCNEDRSLAFFLELSWQVFSMYCHISAVIIIVKISLLWYIEETTLSMCCCYEFLRAVIHAEEIYCKGAGHLKVLR